MRCQTARHCFTVVPTPGGIIDANQTCFYLSVHWQPLSHWDDVPCPDPGPPCHRPGLGGRMMMRQDRPWPGFFVDESPWSAAIICWHRGERDYLPTPPPYALALCVCYPVSGGEQCDQRMRWFFQASVSDCSNPRLCRLLLCIFPCPSCYSNPPNSYRKGLSAHLGVPHLRPSISVCHTRSFAHLGVSRLRPSMPTTHPVLPLPSGSGPTACPSPH